MPKPNASTWAMRLTRLLLGALIALLALAFVGGSAFAGTLFWNHEVQAAEQAARLELGPCVDGRTPPSCNLAAQQIPKVFGYDYQTVERSLNEVYPMLTPSYRQEFKDRAAKDIIPQARERQLVSQATVVGSGVMTAQRDAASVMVYMNRTITDKSKTPVYDGSRLRVDYQKIGGKWLIQYITPI
jgi:Mce-associated membrane protein